jgi:WD40 repeat protein
VVVLASVACLGLFAAEQPGPPPGVVHALKGHTEAIYTVAFTADGKHVLTGSFDKSLKLWDVATGKEVKTLAGQAGHQNLVLSSAFSPDGRLIASGGADNQLRLWEAPLNVPLRDLPQGEAVQALALSPDGARLAVAGKDGVIRVVNPADGKPLFQATGHAGPILAVAFSPNNQFLASGGGDKTLRIWNAGNGQQVATAEAHPGAVHAVAFHPNSSLVFSAGDGGMWKSWKVPLPTPPASVQAVQVNDKPLRCLAVTPTGSHVLVGGDEPAVHLYGIDGGASQRTFPGSGGPVLAVAVSRNNALVATGGADKTVRLYQLADAKLLGSFPVSAPVRSLAFSPNHQTLTAACEDQSVPSWALQPPALGKPLQGFAHAAAATSVVYASDGNSFYTGSADRTVKAWKFASENPIRNLGHPNLVDAVAFHPDGSQLATGGHDGNVRLWDVVKGQQLRQIAAHTTPAVSPIYSVAWTPDGKQVASASLDRTIKLWDAGSGNLVREFKAYKEKEFDKGHRDGVFCIAFSPDGKLLVSGGSDRHIKIWNVADGTVLRECSNPGIKPAPDAGGVAAAHPGWVYSLRLTPDGQRIVSVGNAPRNEGYLAVWSLADGKLLHGQELPLGPIYTVAVSPDGKLLALGGGPRGRGVQDVDGYLFRMP